ncbi:MAG: hypothetical protein R3C19_03165 [Planctomycetaceae bacterium]
MSSGTAAYSMHGGTGRVRQNALTPAPEPSGGGTAMPTPPAPVPPEELMLDNASSALAPLQSDDSGEAEYSSDPAGGGSAPVRDSHSLTMSLGPAGSSDSIDLDSQFLLLNDDEVVEELRELGGTVQFDGEALTGVDLSFTRTRDDHLKRLSQFDTVRNLNLTGTDVSDAGIGELSRMQSLKSLKLRGTDVTNAALPVVGQISGLQLLDLSRTRIADAGLVHLQQLAGLRYLMLNDTRLSDEALPHLKSLGKLDGLSLIHTQISPDGQQELQQALPSCLIVFEADDDVSHTDVPAEFRPAATVAASSSVKPFRTVAATRLDRKAISKVNPKLAQVVELAEKQPELATHLSAVYSADGDWSSAIHVLQAALDAAPENLEIRYQLAVAFARSGDLVTAAEQFERSVGKAAAHYNIGVLLQEQMLATCEAHLQQSLAINPKLEAARLRLKELKQHSEHTGVLPASAVIPSDPSLPVIQPREVYRAVAVE